MAGSYEDDGPQLYTIDPSGVSYVSLYIYFWKLNDTQSYYFSEVLRILNVFLSFQGYYGCAIGKAKQAAKTEIEKIKVCFNLVPFVDR